MFDEHFDHEQFCPLTFRYHTGEQNERKPGCSCRWKTQCAMHTMLHDVRARSLNPQKEQKCKSAYYKAGQTDRGSGPTNSYPYFLCWSIHPKLCASVLGSTDTFSVSLGLGLYETLHRFGTTASSFSLGLCIHLKRCHCTERLNSHVFFCCDPMLYFDCSSQLLGSSAGQVVRYNDTPPMYIYQQEHDEFILLRL